MWILLISWACNAVWKFTHFSFDDFVLFLSLFLFLLCSPWLWCSCKSTLSLCADKCWSVTAIFIIINGIVIAVFKINAHDIYLFFFSLKPFIQRNPKFCKWFGSSHEYFVFDTIPLIRTRMSFISVSTREGLIYTLHWRLSNAILYIWGLSENSFAQCELIVYRTDTVECHLVTWLGWMGRKMYDSDTWKAF